GRLSRRARDLQLLLHRALGFEACEIPRHGCHGGHPVAQRIADGTIAALQAAVDRDRIPARRVADIVDVDVVEASPEELHIGEGLTLADDRAGDRLPLSFGHDPMLDPSEPTTPRLWPA